MARLVLGWALVAMFVSVSPPAALPSEPPPTLDPRSFAPCPETARVCARLRLWIAAPADADATFLQDELATANRLHAPARLGFEVAAIEPLPSTLATIETRADRDRLGFERSRLAPPPTAASTSRTPRVIDVFVVSRLGDVDAPLEPVDGQPDVTRAAREIRGVHWRHRKDRARRWIILSRISPPHVLAHELGHYFGLPHSDDPRSLMNTGPTALPASDRSFQPNEIATIERRAKRFLASERP